MPSFKKISKPTVRYESSSSPSRPDDSPLIVLNIALPDDPMVPPRTEEDIGENTVPYDYGSVLLDKLTKNTAVNIGA